MHYLSNKRGVGYIDTAVKIIIAVVVGALILGGLFLLFGGDSGILGKADSEVKELMDVNEDNITVRSATTGTGGQNTLEYSYDGKHWYTPNMPDYGETATVYGLLNNGNSDAPVHVALIKDGTQYYVLTSTNRGANWTEQVSFTANAITHCYYGTSSQLPSTSGSFQGEAFVIRWQKGTKTFYTMISRDERFKLPEWSDLILI